MEHRRGYSDEVGLLYSVRGTYHRLLRLPRGLAARFFLLCSLCFAPSLSSAPTLVDPVYSSAVWTAQQKHLSKYTIEDISQVLDIAHSYDALSVDPKHGNLWAVNKNGVTILGFDGSPVAGIVEKIRPHPVLATSDQSGETWLGHGREVLHFDFEGLPAGSFSVDGSVMDIDIDAAQGRLWVSTHKAVEIFDLQDQYLSTLIPEAVSNIKAAEYDAFLDELWISGTLADASDGNNNNNGNSNNNANGNSNVNSNGNSNGNENSHDDRTNERSFRLHRFSTSGNLHLTVPVHNIRFLRATSDGYLWAASHKKLHLIHGESGAVLFSVFPFDNRGTIQALALDPTNDGVWIANNHEVVRVSNDSTISKRIKVQRKIRDLAVYADTVVPDINITAPSNGDLLNTDHPDIAVEYDDNAIGVDSESLIFYLNGEPLVVSCEFEESGANCLPNAPFPEGEVTLAATIQDFAGNSAEEALANITIDTIPPEISVESPLDGTVTREEMVFVKGSVSEQAIVKINGIQTELEGLSFERAMELEEGDNIIELKAVDTAGNTSTVSVRVVREVGDVTPPEVSAPPDIVLEATDKLTPVALGGASALDDEDGSLFAFPSTLGPFPVGVTEVIWTATDTSGNIGQANQFVTVRDTIRPVLYPPPHISLAATGPVSVTLGEAQATDLFGPVYVTNDAPKEFPFGSTVVTWIARDRNGNLSQEMQTVAVFDENDPNRSNGWGAPELLEFDSDHDAGKPVLVMNERGHGIVVWAQESGSDNFALMARHYDPVSGWGASNRIDDNAPVLADSLNFPPQHDLAWVALNEDGRGLAIWRAVDETHYYNTFDIETGWSDARSIESSSNGLVDEPLGLKHTSDGVFVAIWISRHPDNSANIVAQIFTIETGWDPAVVLETNEPGVRSQSHSLRLETNSSGEAMIAWHRFEPHSPTHGISHGRLSSAFHPDSGWSTPAVLTPLFSGTPISLSEVDLVFEDPGSALAYWREGTFDGDRLMTQRYLPVSDWGELVEIQLPDMTNILPRMVRSHTGDLYLGWVGSESGFTDLDYEYRFKSSVDGGATWTEPFVTYTNEEIEDIIERDIGDRNFIRRAGVPRFETNGEEYVHTLFEIIISSLNERPTKHLLFSNTFENGTGWSTPQIVSAQEHEEIFTDHIRTQTLKTDLAGNAIAVWSQRDPVYGRYDIWTNRLVLPLAENVAAVADAGTDVTISESGFTVLDGSRSMDPDGFIFRYHWTQISGPPVVIDDPASPVIVVPTAPVVDSDTVLAFQLEVTDSRGQVTTDVVHVKVRNLGTHEDKTPPVVTAPSDRGAQATDILTPVSIVGGEAAFDNADGELVPVPDNTGPFPLGVTIVTWRVVDAAGNVGTATQEITVVDTRRPVLTIPDDVSVESAIPVAVDIGEATAEDIFGPVEITNNAPAIFPVGVTQVTWQATDQNGNTSTGVQEISVAAKLWGDPVLLEFEEHPVSTPSLDIDNFGNAVAAWLVSDGVNQRVMANRYDPASGWLGAEAIATFPLDTYRGADEVAVASYGHGSAVAVWVAEPIGAQRQVTFSRYIADVGWTTPEVILTAFVEVVLVEGGANSVVLFFKNFSSGKLEASRFTEASGWSDLFEISDNSASTGLDLDVSDNDHAVAVWTDGAPDIEFRYFEPQTGWGPVIAGNATGTGESPKVRVNDAGVVFFAWDEKDGSRIKPYVSTYTPVSGLDTPLQLRDRGSGVEDIAVDDNGNAMVVWVNRDIFSNSYTKETGWSDYEPAEFLNDGIPLFVNLGMDEAGRSIMTWRHNIQPTIFGNRHVPGIGWGFQEPLALETGDFGDAPVLAVPPNGQAIAVWQQKDEQGFESIWANRLVNAEIPNQAPNANAGPDRPIFVGVDVTLDGTGSVDPDGEILSAAWRQTNGPAVVITNSDTLAATFTTPDAPLGIQLSFEVTVTDDLGATGSDIVTFTVSEPDVTAPVVTPPPDLTIEATAVLTPIALGGASAVDEVDGELVPSPDRTGPFSLGSHNITWSATDSSGNTGTTTQTITLRDTTPPDITAPEQVAVVAADAVDLDIGEATASDLFGSVTIQNNAPDQFPVGNTSVTWSATDANGNTSTATQLVRVEAGIALAIVSPSEGAQIDSDTVLVSGTVIAQQNTGVLVNGRIAAVDRNRVPATFNAVISLEPGDNIITVVATHQSGETVSGVLNVVRTGPAEPPFVVTTTPETGPAPLEVTFDVQRTSSSEVSGPEGTVYVVDYDFDGDGIVDLSNSSFTVDGNSIVFEPVDLSELVTHTYEVPGVYPATVTINNLNNINPNLNQHGFVFAIPIEILQLSMLDKQLRLIWVNFKESLISGDVDAATKMISAVTRARYEEMFQFAGDQLGPFASQLGTLEDGSLIGENIAEYLLVRNTPRGLRGFEIYFIRGLDGVWRIEGM